MRPEIEFALSLLAAHLVVDFAGARLPDLGQRRTGRALLVHGGLVAAAAYAFAGRGEAWLAALILGGTHALIDRFGDRRAAGLGIFAIDQAAHLLVIAALAFGMRDMAATPSGWSGFFGRDWNRLLVLVIGGMLCVRVVGVLVGFWVKPYLDELTKANPAGTAARGLSEGGRAIGQWERALIFLLLLMQQPASIGFLVAAKSIFRFGELKDRENRMEAEYITIGTLMSFTLAVAVAWLTARWVRLL